MDFSYVHIRYFIGYVYHICLQDTIQSTLSLCLRCQAMLLPMPLRPLLLTTRSGFNHAPTTPQLQPPLDRKQTTRKPANTKPARRARVERGTASRELVTPWCAAPADDHTHEHRRAPQLYHYERDQPTLTNYTTLHLDQPRRN